MTMNLRIIVLGLNTNFWAMAITHSIKIQLHAIIRLPILDQMSVHTNPEQQEMDEHENESDLRGEFLLVDGISCQNDCSFTA